MTAWLHTVPALLSGLLIMVVPGSVVAYFLRLRGLSFLTISVVASFALIALSSVVTPLLGITWGVLPVLVCTIPVAFLAWVLTRRRYSQPHSLNLRPVFTFDRVGPVIGFTFAAGIIAWVLVRSIGYPDALSQNYDTPFHVNTVQQILMSGNASPFATTLTNHGGVTTFYPTLWHAFVALIIDLAGVSPIVANNVASILVSAFVWPLSMLFFTLSVVKRTTTALIFASVLTPMFASFPYRFFNWGLLYPNLLSNALLPVFLACVVGIFTFAASHWNAPRVSLWVGAFGALGAASAAHPNAIFAALAILLPLVMQWAFTRWQTTRTRRQALLSALTVITHVGIIAVLWGGISTADNSRTYGDSLIVSMKEALVTSPFINTDMWLLGAIVIAGAILALRQTKSRWIVVSYITTLTLFVIAMGPDTVFRTAVTGAWYNDAHRLAALLPLLGIPLATIALERLFVPLNAGFRASQRSRASQHSRVTASIIIVASLFGVFVGQLYPAVRADISPNFAMNEESALVTPNERALFERIDELTPEDALIASDPSIGSTYIFALTGRSLLFPHFKGDFTEASRELALVFIDDPGRACELITDLEVTHFVGSEDELYVNSQIPRFVGLHELDKSPLLDSVEQVGTATLYSVTGCD